MTSRGSGNRSGKASKSISDWEVQYRIVQVPPDKLPALADAVAKVLHGQPSFESLPNLLRQLESRRVHVGVGDVLAAIRADLTLSQKQGRLPRFQIGMSGYERLIRSLENAPTKSTRQALKPPKREVPLPSVAVLQRQLLALHPTAFEAVVERLLLAMGVQEVQRTPPSKDAGIDVRGLTA